MEGGPPVFRQDCTCPALLEIFRSKPIHTGLSPAPARLSSRFWSSSSKSIGLVRVRSPLLTEFSLMSFPPGTEMFQFPGFAFIPLCDSRNKSLLLISVGPKTAAAALSGNNRTARSPSRERPCAASPRMTQRASSEQQRSKVGFPIRKFTDQSLFAAPHDLSQRTTSFIASQRQGIHQIPLRHLIALIAKARFHKDGQPRTENGVAPSSVLCLPCVQFAPGVEKTSFASNASGRSERSGSKTHDWLLEFGRTENRDRRIGSSSVLWLSVVRFPASTECASSSQCQISKDGGQTTENGSPSRRPSGLPDATALQAPRRN